MPLMLGIEGTSVVSPISEAMADAISVWNCAWLMADFGESEMDEFLGSLL